MQQGVGIVELAAHHRLAQALVEVGAVLHAELVHKQPFLAVNGLHAKRRAVLERHAFDHLRAVRSQAVAGIALRIVVLAGFQRARFEAHHLHGMQLAVVAFDLHDIAGLQIGRAHLERTSRRAALKLHALALQFAHLGAVLLVGIGHIGLPLFLGGVTGQHVLNLGGQHLARHIRLLGGLGEIALAVKLPHDRVHVLLVAPAEHDALPEWRDVGTLQPVEFPAHGLALLLAQFPHLVGVDGDAALHGDAGKDVHLAVVRIRQGAQATQRLLGWRERRRFTAGLLFRFPGGIEVIVKVFSSGFFRGLGGRFHVIERGLFSGQRGFFNIFQHTAGLFQFPTPRFTQVFGKLVHLSLQPVDPAAQIQPGFPHRWKVLGNVGVLGRELALPNHPAGLKIQHVSLLVV